jgi:hypothetical protein
MHYLTQYYKNLSEQLQEQINIFEKQINEAKVRNPELQFRAQFRDYNNPNSVSRHNTLPGGFPSDSGGAGWKRMNQMVQFQAAKAIAHPHEQEAIEAVLTDMANTTPEAPGTAANAQHIRTALGALKRLSGTEAFQTSFKNLQSEIDKKAADEVLGGDDPMHFYSGRLSREEDDRFANKKFDEAQKRVLGYAGPRKPTREPDYWFRNTMNRL